MNRRLISVFLFAFVISAGASYLIYRVISAQITSSARPAEARLVVATHNLETGALIREGDVKLAGWAGTVPPGAYTDVKDVVDRGVVQPVYDGEPLVASRLAPRGAGAGLAAIIPPGMRAVAVRVNDVVGVAGFVTPGMRVDVLIAGNPPGGSQGTVGTLGRTLLQNIEVLSAGQNIQKDAEGKPVSVQVVNLLVNPEQAEVLSLAGSETRIQLVLRNPLDKETAKTTGTAVAYLFGPVQPAPAAKPAPKPARVRKVAPPPPAPVVVAPAPEEKKLVPFKVEVIHGSKRTETTFQLEPEKTTNAWEAPQ